MDVARKWIERTWKPIIFVGLAVFMVWFMINQAGGLARLWQFLLDAVATIPQAITVIIDYYQTLPSDLWIQPALIGGGIGAVMTSLVILSANRWVTFPNISLAEIATGLIVIIILNQLGIYLFDAFIVALIIVIIWALILQRDDKSLLRLSTWRAIGWQRVFVGALIGFFIGAIGSQLLNYPLRHCTLTPEADVYTYHIGLMLTGIGAMVLLLPVWTIILQRQRKQEHGAGYFKGLVTPLLLLAPTLISLVVFLYYPSVQIALQSFTRQRGRREANFVCLDNYADLLNDTVYRGSFVTTFLITAGIVIFSMILGLMIAVLASQKIRGASIYRTLLIWPYAVSPVVTAVIFIAIFRNDPNGFANYYLGWAIGGAQNWIGNPNLAPWVIILASVWNALGFNILFYIAGLQNVPKDLLEAAQIDGANVVQRFLRITFPLLSPFTFFLLITNITFGVYGIYGVVETLTQGGPPIGDGAGATNVLIYKLYADLLSTGAQIGNVAAQSVILFVLVAIITIAQFQFVERRVTYSGD